MLDNWTHWGNTASGWLGAGLLASIMLFLLWVMVRFVLSRLAAFARTTDTDLDDLIAHVGARTRLSLLLLPALYVGASALNIPVDVRTWFRVLAWTAFLIQGAVWGDGAISFWLQDFREEHGEEVDRVTTLRALSFVFRLLLYTIVIILVLDNVPGIEVTALIGSLGVGGIAVALAVQSVLGDLFASLSIALDKPFVLGDYVEVGEENGTVEYIGLKTTRLRRLSGEELVVGTSDLLNSRIRNYGRMNERRVVFSFRVASETPVDKLQQIPGMLRQIIEELPDVRFGRAHFVRIGDFGQEYEVVYYVLTPDYDLYMDLQQSINLAMVSRFAAEGIRVPYPTQAINLVPAQA